MRRFGVLAIGAVMGALVATCAQSSGQAPRALSESADKIGNVLSAPAYAAPGPAPVPADGALTVADVAERTVPSVVSVSATKTVAQQQLPMFNDPMFREFFGRRGIRPDAPREREQHGMGSGVIVTADGVVVTNNHVVDGAREVTVALADGREFSAEVAGTDPKSDLAVLRLEGDVKDLQPIALGDSSALRLGETVIAIGNPFGVGQTVTMGIVSAIGRNGMGIVDYEDFIQTDAAINPGNSGGALVNMRGELVGINTAILSRSGGYQGIGFAIPTSLVEPVMTSLVEHGKVMRGWLGVAIQDLDAELAAGLGVSADKGVVISDVSAGSPADRGGLARGDVIVGMNGHEMSSTSKLRNEIALAGPGTVVDLDVVRGGKQLALKVELGELPGKLAGGTPENEVMEPDAGALEGAMLRDLTPALKRRLAIPDSVEHGVVVADVDVGSRAHRAGLRPGDVILELNRKPVGSTDELRAAYEKSTSTALLLVQRQSATIYIAIKR